jgi:hypothetical protein
MTRLLNGLQRYISTVEKTKRGAKIPVCRIFGNKYRDATFGGNKINRALCRPLFSALCTLPFYITLPVFPE